MMKPDFLCPRFQPLVVTENFLCRGKTSACQHRLWLLPLVLSPSSQISPLPLSTHSLPSAARQENQNKRSLLTMEGTESTTRENTTAKDKNQDADNTVLMSSKPLHRFVQRQPRALGIVIVIFGCAELLMGFQLAGEVEINSSMIYIPFWQGVLFLVCGNLSIFTDIHPSKKMVTVCLAMYVVSLLGITVSFGYRIFCLVRYSDLTGSRYHRESPWELYRLEQLFGIEGVLFTSSLCVSVILIFLCVISRLALKSTRTQIIVHHIPAPQRVTSSN